MFLTRADIIVEARAWIGTPYRHQASLKGVGCDCLGLVRGVWRELIGDEPQSAPAYSRDWAEASGEESLANAARALCSTTWKSRCGEWPPERTETMPMNATTQH